MEQDIQTLRSVKDYDFTSREVTECPWPFYQALHREAPVFRPEGHDFYIISRYADAQKVLRDPATFSNNWYSRLTNPHPEVSEILARGVPRKDVLNTCDPPNHGRYRKLVDKVFTPRRVKEMEGYIQALIDGLIDSFIDAGEVDLVPAFASKLPGAIIADMLGLPPGDREQLKQWAEMAVVPLSRTADLETRKMAARMKVDCQHYMLNLLKNRRANPGDDFASALAMAEYEDELDEHGQPRRLDEAEFVLIVESLNTGGNESTANAIGNGMLYLIEHPEIMERLRAQPELMPRFVEELLRIDSPVQGVPRLVVKDTEVGGVHLPAGTLLDVRVGAANLDAEQFPDPYRMDLDRPNSRNHVTFGSGIHFCIGAALARRDLAMSFTSLIGRLDNIALKPGCERPPHLHTFLVRGVTELPITFTRRG